MSNPVGRPTKYSEYILKKTLEYIDSCEDTEKQLLKQSGDNKYGGYETYENKLVVNLPSIEGLAFFLKVDKGILYDWEKKHKELHHAFNELRAKQAKVVLNKGLSGEYNPTIAKLILSNNHGYKERTDTTSNDETINVSVINYSSSNDYENKKSKTKK